MAKYTFVVEATISMHCEVEAESLDDAIEQAQNAGPMSLCHQCAHGSDGEWNTSGELDCEPTTSPLVEVIADGKLIHEGKAFDRIVRKWGAS